VPHVRRALISVSDKRGLIEFARALRGFHVEIISTGGTFNTLKAHGIDATPVSEITHFPEILDGRVKTLHPMIHGGLLAVADNPEHQRQLKEHDIEPIDMVVVNLYPFEQTIARNGLPMSYGPAGRTGVALEEALEQIDIGGPTMIRAAAKNFKHKVVIVNPDRYSSILEEMKASGGEISEATCLDLAKEVFRHTTSYDAVISNYLNHAGRPADNLPMFFQLSLRKEQDLRYGENPHQHASLYGDFGSVFRKLHGKELSYNNIVDISAAARLIAEFDEPTAAIIKHTNPCGVGSGATVAEAFSKALATDSKSAFGGIIAANRPLDLEAAGLMNQLFTEVILVPDFEDGVLDLLQKKKDRRLIRFAASLRTMDEPCIKSVPGGLLVQEPDGVTISQDMLKVVTKRQPTEYEVSSMLFAWRVAKHVKSNAIVYARHDRTIGIGAGQMSRIDSARFAALKAAEAGLDLKGTVVASDAFFPFADGLLEAIRVGSTAVIQPGGSIRDDEVIRAADEHNIAMVCTSIRHFMH
jgi:phosphoribosylaminoimidazolecarboxamide formyltransferase/IMP cyclohydrolase